MKITNNDYLIEVTCYNALLLCLIIVKFHKDYNTNERSKNIKIHIKI